MRRLFIAVLISVGLLSSLLILPASFAEEAKRGGTLRIGMTPARHLNNAVQSGNATGVPATQIFAGLIEFDDKFNPQPYLAKSWEISDHGLTYTFHLVENATFHDGKPITSEDVAFSMDIVKNNHPFGVAMFGAVDRVETPNPHTAVIKLKNPHPALLVSVSSILLPILPKHIYGTGDIQTHPANTNPVGSGPFKLVEWKAGEHIILERNNNYFRPGLPYLDRITFKVIKDPATRLLAVENGEIDYLPFSEIRFRDVPRLQKNPKIGVTEKGYEALGMTNYLEFNHRIKPFNDLRVRKAIAYAIDRDFIVKKLHDNVTRRLDGPLHHSSPFFAANAITYYKLDLDKANKLLDEAGYSKKTGGIRFKFTLDYGPTFNPESQRPVAEFIKTQLRKVGIDVILRASPDFPSWASLVSNWNYEATVNAIWNWPDPVIGVHRAYLCTNVKKGVIWSNTEGYCNTKVDQILNEAGRSVDLEKRKALYAEFQKIVTDELPFLWTNEEVLTTVWLKDKVRNLPLSIWGGMAPYDKMYLTE